MDDSVNPPDPPLKGRRGRPKLPPGERKEVMLRVRMSAALREALDAEAEKEFKTASELIRELVEKRLGMC